MAIDSALKRKSISGILMPLIVGVAVDAAKPVAWRQAAGWSYAGIAASSGITHTFGDTRRMEVPSSDRVITVMARDRTMEIAARGRTMIVVHPD